MRKKKMTSSYKKSGAMAGSKSRSKVKTTKQGGGMSGTVKSMKGGKKK